MKGGAETRMWISFAPASRRRFTIRALVVPRTMESSISTTRLSFDRRGHWVQLDAHLVLPVRLGGLDERAGDVLVFDEADAVGDARLARIADGSVDAAVRHAHHHVGLHRVLQRQKRPRAQARRVHAGLPSITESGRAK